MLWKGQALKKAYKCKYFPLCDTEISKIILLSKNKQTEVTFRKTKSKTKYFGTAVRE